MLCHTSPVVTNLEECIPYRFALTNILLLLRWLLVVKGIYCLLLPDRTYAVSGVLLRNFCLDMLSAVINGICQTFVCCQRQFCSGYTHTGTHYSCNVLSMLSAVKNRVKYAVSGEIDSRYAISGSWLCMLSAVTTMKYDCGTSRSQFAFSVFSSTDPKVFRLL